MYKVTMYNVQSGEKKKKSAQKNKENYAESRMHPTMLHIVPQAGASLFF